MGNTFAEHLAHHSSGSDNTNFWFLYSYKIKNKNAFALHRAMLTFLLSRMKFPIDCKLCLLKCTYKKKINKMHLLVFLKQVKLYFNSKDTE